MRKRLVIPIVLMIVSAAAACGIVVYTKSNAGSPSPGMTMQQGKNMPDNTKSDGQNGASTDQNGQNQQSGEASPPALPSGEKSSGNPPEKPSGNPSAKPSGENGSNDNSTSSGQMPPGENGNAPNGDFGQGGMKPSRTSANIPTIIALGFCTLVFSFNLMYLILSKLGTESVLTNTKRKKLILGFGAIGLCAILTTCLTLVINFM